MNGQDDYRSAGALSSRLDRVWAVLIDWGLAALFPLFGLLGGLSWASKVVLDALATGRPGLGSRPTGPVATLLLASTVATVLLALYQLYSLAVRGQTLGKRLMGIQIVDDAGRPAGFFRAVLLRSWVFGLLTGLVQGCLSIAGIVVPLVDALFIFGDERRTLHDLLAGTWVRDAAEAPRRAAPALAAFATMALALGVLLSQAGVDLRPAELRRVAEPLSDAVREKISGSQGGQRSPGQASGASPTSDVRLSPKASTRIYRYEDENGTVQFSDELESIPRKHRASAKLVE